MGKLHYVNRKSAGAKLGSVVAKDLLKRLSNGTARRAALRDPVVELDLSAKELNDEAVIEVAEALTKVISSNEGSEVVLKLEELCFAGNSMTAASLPSLARLVRCSASELRDLDLSSNTLSITTAEEARAWEEFVSSFARSNVLRRLDLGGNILGVKAFEVLCKVYTRESIGPGPAQDVMSTIPSAPNLQVWGGSKVGADGVDGAASEALRRLSLSSIQSRTSVKVIDDSVNGEDEIDPEDTAESADAGITLQYGSPEMQLGSFSLTHGLRSVPYLILDKIEMTNTCALHLSYIVAEHELPGELLPYVPAAKAGPPAQRLWEYDRDLKCRGIMYRGIQALGNDGVRVLELAEGARDKACKNGGATPDTPTFPVAAAAARRLIEKDSLPLLRTPKTRRASNISGGSQEPSPQSRVHDLGSLRNKLQGESIRNGIHGNELWFAAVRMLGMSRSILAQPRAPAFSNGYWSGFQQEDDRSTTSKISKDFPRLGMTPGSERSSSAPEGVTGSSNDAVVLRLHQGKNGHVLLPTTPPAVAAEWKEAKPRLSDETLAALNKEYRSALPCGFDERIWASVLSRASEAHELLSVRQQMAVAAWARNRTTLHQEMCELGKPRANQIWRVLDCMGCLSYESQ